ncbi:hypothetical protein [Streptomyces poonensis]|uniref:Uncharacterized protein n=1 Tax=Streptomyces poonensis TaxID=68255 RepID=A0A918PBR9_9ACTN|nr:hypothetical protein GCM10010365_14860 [Streptomyces poonensis]
MVIRERGIDGSPVNQYAPFICGTTPVYLWNDTGLPVNYTGLPVNYTGLPVNYTGAMVHFLVGGGGFQNSIRDFGPRPPGLEGVSRWPGPAGRLPRKQGRSRTAIDLNMAAAHHRGSAPRRAPWECATVHGRTAAGRWALQTGSMPGFMPGFVPGAMPGFMHGFVLIRFAEGTR